MMKKIAAIKRLLKNIHAESRGITFIELMVAMGIFIGVAAAIFAILSGGRRAWLTSEAQIDVQSELRHALIAMTGELGLAGPGTVFIVNVSAAEDRIIFQTPSGFAGGAVTWGSQIQFSLGGNNGHQLMRTDITTGQTESLANYITALHFSQPAADLVQIAMAGERQAVSGNTPSMQITTQVALRNR